QRTRFGWEPYLALVVAQAHIRLGRLEDARAVLTYSLSRSQAAGQQAYVEWAQAYQGLLHLLVGDDAAALAVLRQSVRSMQGAGRRLILPAALLYLSEAEARAGAVETAAELAACAFATVDESGSAFALQQALIDVPGAGARRESTPVRRTSRTARPRHDVAAADASHDLVVHSIGPRPDLFVDGVACDVRRLKVLEFSAYLAAHAGSVGRNQVQLALFPDSDQRTGSNYFRQITHQFRRATGIVLMRYDDNRIGLPPGSTITSIDVELERLVATKSWNDMAIDEITSLLDLAEGSYLE